MKPDDFVRTMQRRTGVTAVGPSALRGQGKGVLKATQVFLGKLDLSCLSVCTAERFQTWLDEQTESLLDCLPIKNRPWGAARKAMNLFMRDCLYNQYLCKNLGLGNLEYFLEVPLDNAVAKGLKSRDDSSQLPRWPGLKHLKDVVSCRFQNFAGAVASKKGTARVHLDVYLWLENR